MAQTSYTPSRAIVASEPSGNLHGGENWELQDILVPKHLNDGELLVEMVATGICHTDLVTTSRPAVPAFGLLYPRIAGHEGAGYVKEIGPNVTKDVKIGDPVLLSFDHCGKCHYCKSAHPAYCESMMLLNIIGKLDACKSKDGKQDIAGKFFGQGSFANLSVVSEASVMPVRDLIKHKDELKLFAPMGCAIQTGAGTVLNVAKAGKEDRVMVLGLGSVGLSAVLAAVISGCHQIIAVDKLASRIELAKSLGATHGLDTTGISDMTAAMKQIAEGIGPSIIIDTTGAPPVIEAAYHAIANGGQLIQVGVVADPNWTLNIKAANDLARGVAYRECMEGDCVPAEIIPKLIQYYREGKLPLDKINKYYKAEDFKEAVHHMHTGESIKAVLLW